MHPDLVKEFIAEYHRELNRLGATQEGARRQAKRGLESVGREIREIIDAIKSGIRGPTMAAELAALEASKEALERELTSELPPPVRLHPNLAEVYRDKVESLRDALNSEDIRADAATVLRGLIDEIRLVPVDGQLGVYLVGNLAAILDLCAKKNPGSIETGAQITLVAGAGFEPATFRL